MCSTLSGVGILKLLLYTLPLLCQATTPDVGTQEEECADNAHLLVERLRRSYTGHLLKNVLQNFCNGETEVFVHLHHFPDVATCRKMSDKLVDAYSQSTKQKSSMEPYFNWCQEVKNAGGVIRQASRSRRGGSSTGHVAVRPPVTTSGSVSRPIAYTHEESHESTEDKFEQVLRNFKAKLSTPVAQVTPAATVSQQAASELRTTMFTKSGTANAEAPNFAAHMQHQQDLQKNAGSSESEAESSNEIPVQVAKAEPPPIVDGHQHMVAAGSPVSVSKAKERTRKTEQDVGTERQTNKDKSPAAVPEDSEEHQTVAKTAAEHEDSEEHQTVTKAVAVSQPKLEQVPRYDVSGPTNDEANLKPMIPLPKKNVIEKEVPCPSYAVTLSTVGHKPLDRFGAGQNCSLDSFGKQLHGIENELPHLAADGTPLSVEKPTDAVRKAEPKFENPTDAVHKAGPEEFSDKLAHLMRAGMGTGASADQPDISNTMPQQFQNRSDTVEVTDAGHANAAPAVEPAATSPKKKPLQAEPAEVEPPAPTLETKAKAVVQAAKVEVPGRTVESKAEMQADEATKPSPKEHSFEDSLRNFRNAIRKADSQPQNPLPSSEDHFMKKLQAINAAPFLKEDQGSQDHFMNKMQVLSAAISGH